jgi:long-chain fatty acid transport protein
MAGGLLSGGTTRYRSPTGATVTGDRNGSIAWPPPSHTYLVASLKDLDIRALRDLVAGVGFIVPFGSLTRWPVDGPFRTATVFNALPLLAIKPALAYRLTDDLSVGLGGDVYTFSGLIGEGHVERQSIWPGGFGIPAGAQVELFGRGTGAGFNVSLLYAALRNGDDMPIANVGLVYRSQAVMRLAGALLSNGGAVSDARATLVLPQIITGAIAVWPVRTKLREWKLELDVDHVSWSSVRHLDVHLSNGVVIPQPLDWRDTYAVMIGTEVKWLRLESCPNWEVALRVGYSNQQSQMPDRTFDPGIPSSDVHIVGGGIGLTCTQGGLLLGFFRCGQAGLGPLKVKAIVLDLSYQASFYETRTVFGSRNPTVNGYYKTALHTGGISVSMAF